MPIDITLQCSILVVILRGSGTGRDSFTNCSRSKGSDRSSRFCGGGGTGGGSGSNGKSPTKVRGVIVGLNIAN